MLTASILAKRAGVPVFTVRHYTRIGLLTPLRDPSNQYKIYREADVERLRFTITAKELGFTLAEIMEILNSASHGDSPCPMVRDIVDRRIEDNKAKIRELKRLQTRLEAAAQLWTSMENSQPDGHSVCRLIESFASEKVA